MRMIMADVFNYKNPALQKLGIVLHGSTMQYYLLLMKGKLFEIKRIFQHPHFSTLADGRMLIEELMRKCQRCLRHINSGKCCAVLL
jgi:hypothetical protein